MRPSSRISRSALPNAEALPRLPPGSTTQSGTRQSRWSIISDHDGFLPLDAERVDGIQQVDAQALGQLADQRQDLVEIGLHLEGAGAVFERLRQFAEGDVAVGDER